jgi:hypothetical protein
MSHARCSLRFRGHQLLNTVTNKAGFESHIWDDVTDRAIEWFKAGESANAFDNAGRLNLGVVMGEKFKVMATNYRRNLEAGTCGVLQAVLQKRD